MSEAVRKRMAEWIEGHYGIKMPEGKKALLEGRLAARLRAHHLDSFEAYWAFLETEQGRAVELPRFTDLVTTHKTDFFREPAHFDLLANRLVPELMDLGRVSASEPLKVWSAASSTGEEPYTLAMTLAEAQARSARSFDYLIYASDLSEGVVRTAVAGIYPENAVEPVPLALRQKYLRRGAGDMAGKVRVIPELRAKTRFGIVNLVSDHWPVPAALHVIFLRNVMIYFERAVQARLVGRMAEHLVPGGFLVLGHSESIFGMEPRLEMIQPTVYRRL